LTRISNTSIVFILYVVNIDNHKNGECEYVYNFDVSFNTKASAMGNVPKISAYMGMPTMVATRTEYHLSCPSTAEMMDSGIQLRMAAPIPTPIRIYSHTFCYPMHICVYV